MKLSIVIPVYNSSQFISRLLESICKQGDIINNHQFIFVNNNSTDDSVKILKEWALKLPEVEVLVLNYNEKQSSYGARNFGVEKSNGDVLCFIDSDCIMADNYITEVIEALNHNDQKIYSGQIELVISDIRNVWENFDKYANMRNDIKIKQKSAATANLIVPKNIFEELGPFLEITSGGDIEWTKRSVSKGFDLLYREKIKVFHPCRNTYKEIAKKMIRMGIGYGEKSGKALMEKLLTILKYFIKIFYLPTNVRISRSIIKNVGILGIMKFNICFFHLRMLQLRGVFKGMRIN